MKKQKAKRILTSVVAVGMVIGMVASTIIPAFAAESDNIQTVQVPVQITPGHTGWTQNTDGTWKYLRGDGTAITGWLKNNDKWYLMDNNGTMLTGWQRVENTWYYMDASGAMFTGWLQSGNDWYYLTQSGAMAKDMDIDGYYLDGTGKWIENYSKMLESDAVYLGFLSDDDSDSYVKDSTEWDEEDEEDLDKYATSNRTEINLYDEVYKVVDLVNEERSSRGLDTLDVNDTLMEVAELRAEEISEKFSHTRPDGTKCYTAFDECGYDGHTFAENIAYGQTDAKDVMNSWMKSKGHKENILSKSVTEIGVGAYLVGSTIYWVQDFGS